MRGMEDFNLTPVGRRRQDEIRSDAQKQVRVIIMENPENVGEGQKYVDK